MAIGMTEPSGGSDLAALKSIGGQGRRRLDPSTAPRPSSPTATSAIIAVVAARTDPTKGAQAASRCSCWRKDMPGFTKGNKLDKVGQVESDTSELFFENVRVPR
jgi:alkylation response protein AidB-like acyl-CoA dehydrogenase